MRNSETKTQLTKLIFTGWSKDNMHKIYMVEKCFVFGETCTCFFSIDGMKTEAFPGNELYSSQKEADTRIMPYLKHASEESNEKTIIVRSPDTDVLLLTYVPVVDVCPEIKRQGKISHV